MITCLAKASLPGRDGARIQMEAVDATTRPFPAWLQSGNKAWGGWAGLVGCLSHQCLEVTAQQRGGGAGTITEIYGFQLD